MHQSEEQQKTSWALLSPGWVVHEKSQNLWNLQSTSGKQERIFFYLPSFKSLWNIRRFVFCSLRFCLFVCLLAFISCGATIFLHYYLHLSSSAWLLQVNYFGLVFFVFFFLTIIYSSGLVEGIGYVLPLRQPSLLQYHSHGK